MKVKVIDKFLVTQSSPKTFSELRKIHLRHIQGFVSDILPGGSQLAIVYLFLAILTVLGLPFSYFSIESGGPISIAIGLSGYLFIFATLVLVSKKEGKLSYIFQFPYLLIGIFSLILIYIEGLARKVLRKEYFNFRKTPG